MNTLAKTADRTPLENLFFYEIKAGNGIIEFYAYPVFDQDCATRASLDTKHSVHTTIQDDSDADDADAEGVLTTGVAFMDDEDGIDFGYEGDLWPEAEDILADLAQELKAKSAI